ncbi:MAG: hypothetical protein ACJ74W_20235 [Pyrinomonadaceae bacterium]
MIRSVELEMTREQTQAEKDRLRLEYGSLFDSIAEILFRHDPIELNYEYNTDEYESEARTILPRLKTCHSVDDVISMVHEEFQSWFDADEAGPKERYRNIAEEIWLLWQKVQAQK